MTENHKISIDAPISHINVSGGDFHIGHNYNFGKSAEYNELVAVLEDFNKRFSEAQENLEEFKSDKFRKELIDLDAKRQEQEKKIEEFKNEIKKLNDEINSISLNTERLKIVKKHFDAGEVTQARAILNAEKLAMKGELDALLCEKEYLAERTSNNSKHLNDKANEFLLLARFTVFDFDLTDRFEQANFYFKESLRAERNIINLFAYAKYLDGHRQINPAISLYEELELIFRTILQEQKDLLIPKFADVLNNLGGLKLTKHELESAFKYFEEAKIIQQKLVEIGAEIYKPSLARSTNNLAQLFEEQENFDRALELYDEAIFIKRQIAESDNNTINQAAVADSLNDKAICIAKKVGKEGSVNIEEAQQLFEETLAIQRKLHDAERDNFLPEISATLGNLSNVYRDQKKFDLAETMAFEGFEILKKLYQKNPYTYAGDFAKSLTTMALLFKQKGKHEEAEKHFIKSLHIFQDLEHFNPKAFSLEIVINAADLSSLYFIEFKNKEKTLEYAHIALVNAIDLLNKFSPRAESISTSLLEFVKQCGEDPMEFLVNCVNEYDKLEKS